MPTGHMRGSVVPAKAMLAGVSLTKMLSGQDVHAFSNTKSRRNYRISSHLAPMTANKVPASTFPLTTEVKVSNVYKGHSKKHLLFI